MPWKSGPAIARCPGRQEHAASRHSHALLADLSVGILWSSGLKSWHITLGKLDDLG